MDALTEDTQLLDDIDSHPLVQAAAAMRPIVREFQRELESTQRIPEALVAKLRAAGFYSMVIPRSLGGLQVDPLTYLRVVELMAEAVGSVGWNIANNGVGQLISIGLPEEGVQEVYGGGDEVPILAGTAVMGGGVATPVDGGYRVTGRWQFGSGCQESQWMFGSFQILDDGTPRRGPGGGPAYWRGVFPRAETTIVAGSWDVSGLRGTGSFDWTVEDIFLPERRVMIHAGAPLDNQWSRWPGLSYAMPAQSWVGPHHSSVITGIARAGIDALIELAIDKAPRGRGGTMLRDSPQLHDALGRADAILNAGRIYRGATIRELWNTLASGQETTLTQRARARLAAVHAGDCAREAMDLVYRLGGSTSFKRESRLAECWRDLQVVGQTANIAPEWYPMGGRVFLGMDPGSRLR